MFIAITERFVIIWCDNRITTLVRRLLIECGSVFSVGILLHIAQFGDIPSNLLTHYIMY